MRNWWRRLTGQQDDEPSFALDGMIAKDTHYKGHLPLEDIVRQIAAMDIGENNGTLAIVAMPDGSEAHLIVRSSDHVSAIPLDEQEIDKLIQSLEVLRRARRER